MQTNQRNMDNKKTLRYLKLGILSFVVIAAVLIVAKQRNAPFQKNTLIPAYAGDHHKLKEKRLNTRWQKSI